MARRSSSPRLVGRDAELADLIAAVGRPDDERRVILIAGEAGIGKTRLLTELVASLGKPDGDGGSVDTVRGSCLALADGELPFAPILEILDQLLDRSGDASEVEQVRFELSGGLAGSSPSDGGSRGRLFQRIRDELVRSDRGGTLLVIIDDLHWADRSTLDLLVYLARRLRGTGVLLAAAYRSDELHRRHPLRPVLAELRRSFVREEIEIGPLSMDAIGEQVDEIVGREDAELRRRIAERADGNPFHAEELLAVDARDAPLPVSLREVLLARLTQLDGRTIELLGVCAVVGGEVGEAMLRTVLGVDPDAIDAGLRQAVEHAILVPSADGRSYGFRHALIQEAVYDDLLPADRVGFHRRVADALAADPALASASPALRAGELARHRDAAGQTDLAFHAYLEAGAAAFRATAWPEAAAAFDRASAIAAARPGEPIDPRLIELLPRAAFAVYFTGDVHRSVALLRAWIDRARSVGDDATVVELLICLGRLYNTVGDDAAARVAYQEAMATDVPEERVHTQRLLAARHVAEAYMAGRNREAIDLATEILPLAEAAGDVDLVNYLLTGRSAALTLLGRFDEAAADADRLAALPSSQLSVFERGVTITNRGWSLADTGELDTGEALLNDGLRIAADLGVSRDWDPWNLAGLGYVAAMRGDWDEALRRLDASRAFGVGGVPRLVADEVTAVIAAGRGERARAAAALASARTELAAHPDEEGWLELTAAQLARDADDAAERRAHVEAGLAALEGRDLLATWSWLALHGASAGADLAAAAHGRDAAVVITGESAEARRYADLAEAVADGRHLQGSVPTRLTRAIAVFASLEADRAERRDAPDRWADAAAAFEALGYRPQVAELRYREAEACLRVGDRDRAGSALREALRITSSVGMVVLAERVERLTRAARLDLHVVEPAAVRASGAPAGEPAPGDRWGLSEREREVLALVASGRTNGQIGAALFISTKTASVHVTHILDKLGVSSRTEAALVAIQSGLLDRPSDPAPIR